MSNSFVFDHGPNGRYLTVDASGRIIATTTPYLGFYEYGYGDTGRSIVVDASGRLGINIDGVIGNGSSSGIDGTGTTNYLAKWIDSNTINDSIINEIDNNIGIDIITPLATLHVNGSGIFESSLSIGSTNVPYSKLQVEGDLSTPPVIIQASGATSVNLGNSNIFNFEMNDVDNTATITFNNAHDGTKWMLIIHQNNDRA